MDQPFAPSPLAAPGKNYLKNTIGQHPGASALILGVLAVLILILVFALVHYKAKSPSPSMGEMSPNASARHRFGGPQAPASPCAPGETPVAYQNPGGGLTTYCRSTDALPGPPTVCGAGWDPAASAEAEALATTGSLPHEGYGERRLNRAIDAAYDANIGLSDTQLENLMHQGGTP